MKEKLRRSHNTGYKSLVVSDSVYSRKKKRNDAILQYIAIFLLFNFLSLIVQKQDAKWQKSDMTAVTLTSTCLVQIGS